VAEMRANHARTDRQLLSLQQQADRDRQELRSMQQQADRDRQGLQTMQQQADRDRQELRSMQQQADRDRQGLQTMQQQADRDRLELRAMRERAELELRQFNRRMAELSDSMGRLIEDFVAPCAFPLARSIFGTEEAQTTAVRVRRQHPVDPGRSMELDLLAVGPTKLLVVEAKWRVAAGKAREFKEQMAQVPDFFPEYAGKILCPAVASVYLDPSVIAFLNREKIFGIALGEEVMEVVNLGQF
jgi:DNA repair exonuclease SbcCD ATPase subunit